MNIDNIVRTISSGKVALIQTDTTFGLVCNGLNNDAIKKVETIKKRTKPSFGFFVRDVNIAKKYTEMSQWQELCFNTIFPGYFTLILHASDSAINSIPYRALGKINNKYTIGIRIPKNDFCLQLLQHFDFPLLATSANISGQKTATTFEEIDESIIQSVDAIYYDKNTVMQGKSSTILDITDIKNVKIIRSGSGNINELKTLISFPENI